MKLIPVGRLALGVALLGSAAVAQPTQLSPQALAQIQVLTQEKLSRTPAQNKLDSRLLLEVKRRRKDPLFEALPGLRPGVVVEEDGNVLVDIKAEVTPGLLAEILARGGTVINSHPRYRAVRAWLPRTTSWCRVRCRRSHRAGEPAFQR